LRFAILVAGIVSANGFGAWFARAGRSVLADLCASIGSIIFGAGIALVGQMYHLGEDFAGGMLLWAGGALAAGSVWSAMNVFDVPHLPFVALWLIAAGLALAWNSRAAAHLVALAALAWWIVAALQPDLDHFQPSFVLADGAALLFGGGLALAAAAWPRALCVGAVLSTYGAFSLAGVAILEVTTTYDLFRINAGTASQPSWAITCGVAGAIFVLAAAALTRRAGVAFAGSAIGLVLVAAVAWTPTRRGEPWLAYAVELCAMVCLVVSGMIDAARPRIVAGWLGIAGVIAAITWAVKGSLLHRSAFLAAAGAVAGAVATVLNRLLPRTSE